jgi:GalNAc5-diNAcBac-PP-undecaprenol beta-1,3-glucosyltransferase
MSLAATILIPTHNHAHTLRASVASALRQTVPDLEVFVIGDGAPEETREILNEFLRADSRVRFFDCPKGPRHGEIHRHEALAQARGRIVCYLSDDDLYLPRHVEEMSALLEQADFANALATAVRLDGSFSTRTVDLSLPAYRQELIEGRNRVPLSGGAHTLAAYRSLPEGWTSAPAAVPTDLHMWRKFLAQPGCRFQAASLPTVLVFPAPARLHLTTRERFDELQTWLDRISVEPARTALIEQILRQKVRDAAATDASLLDYQWGRSPRLQEFSLQIFFPVTTEHTESGSSRLPVRGGEWVAIEQDFLYPRTKVPVRIDPCDVPALIQISGMRLCAASGQVLWELDEKTSRDVRLDGTAGLLSGGRELRIVSYGRDPQVLLPALTMPAEGKRVRLECRVRLDADVETLAASFCADLKRRPAQT